MIVAHLIGGLGNQMFQYACARSLAQRLGSPLKLDLSGYGSYELRHYALDRLNISAEVATATEVLAFRRRARLQRRLPLWLLKTLPAWSYRIVLERSFEFDPGILELRGNVLLEGYWQSERYFADVGDVIRREFAMRATPREAEKSLTSRIGDTNSVSIHVRRGDYVSNPDTYLIHGVCELDYYKRAVDEISAIEPEPQFFVFSDDPAWVRANLRLGVPITVVDSRWRGNQWDDLRLMSHCRHNIIANSSFSWWGAWLNRNPHKRVIAPKKWFRAECHNTSDLLPDGWTRI